MAYEHIIYEPGTVARIILNRPRYRNAQSWKLLEEMDAAFGEAEVDPDVKVIILSGNGPSFSAGHDLGTPDELADRERRGYDVNNPLDVYARQKQVYIDAQFHWRNLPKPTIAMVHGYCIFGGWMIASAMDVIFAADDALFLPSHFQYFSVPYDLGARKTKELLFENRVIKAQEAHELGFVNRLYPPADLERETLAYASRVAEADPEYLRLVKFSVHDVLDRQGYSGSINTAFHSQLLPANQPDRSLSEGKRQFSRVGGALERFKASEEAKK